MAAPTLTQPFQTEYVTGATTDEFTLSPPGTGEVKFYVVQLGFPSGSDVSDWTPSSDPGLQRPRDTYDMRWPTTTAWEVPWFVLAVRGSLDLPILTWNFPINFESLTIASATISDCTFQLRAADLTDPTDDQLSPAGEPGCFYSIRGGIGVGDNSAAPPTDQMFTVAETATLPTQACDPAAGFVYVSAIYATVTDPGPPTIGNDAETFAVSTWSTNTSFFPDVWGSTLSIYAPNDAPSDTYGWHTGRIGWA